MDKELNIDKLEKVKFEFGCCKCNKVIKGTPQVKHYKNEKESGTELYCKKCFKKLGGK